MRWKNVGQIFDPSQHGLLGGCREFAQSPQTLVFDDFIRVYFSTRTKEPDGMFVSHVAFADFDPSFSRVVAVNREAVVPLGGLGCFDEHGIFPLNVVRVGKKVYGYTCGWSRRVSVPVETSIGFVVSDDDGLSFRRMGDGPVLTSSLHEPVLVCDPFVIEADGSFHMWYVYGTSWETFSHEAQPARVYKIGYATSRDGIAWEPEGRALIADAVDRFECQALPSVVRWDGRYHMVFCYRHATGFRQDRDKGYRLGYAYSDDLKDWTRDDAALGLEVTADGWDCDMQCYPHLFVCGGKLHLMYNGNAFGRHGFGLAVLDDLGGGK